LRGGLRFAAGFDFVLDLASAIGFGFGFGFAFAFGFGFGFGFTSDDFAAAGVEFPAARDPALAARGAVPANCAFYARTSRSSAASFRCDALSSVRVGSPNSPTATSASR
jgi:hypothetical protein